MVSSSAQLAPHPRPGGTSQIVDGGPPAAGIFLILLSAQNPIHAPSGEKNGPMAPSVPGSSVASGRSSCRRYSCGTYICGRPSRAPLNTARRPSGEIAIAVRLGRTETDSERKSAGATPICSRVTGGVLSGRRDRSQSEIESLISTAPTTNSITTRQRGARQPRAAFAAGAPAPGAVTVDAAPAIA